MSEDEEIICAKSEVPKLERVQYKEHFCQRSLRDEVSMRPLILVKASLTTTVVDKKYCVTVRLHGDFSLRQTSSSTDQGSSSTIIRRDSRFPGRSALQVIEQRFAFPAKLLLLY